MLNHMLVSFPDYSSEAGDHYCKNITVYYCFGAVTDLQFVCVSCVFDLM